ncbi:hypothetical protein [Lacipirellula parvula]|uniref:Uncharacterized protein n=1 Tax=Lacipirellula parvula TaxID=2650471 RepID=A0A5K7XKV0_9BACT|nr:hypothetical protein [Lacipirellula parvula]BBO35013.1 hypothetical protein PLANPX_4625 [Lacipirellula parvula]
MDDFKPQPAAAPPKPPLGPPIRSAKSRKLQFSLRSMLIATAAFAVVAAVVGLIGHDVVELATLLVILCMLPVAVGTLAVYCRGERRTFFGGAVAGLLLLLPFADSAYRGWFGGLIPSIVLEVAAIAVGGFTARYVRRFAAARGWDRESDAG